MTSFKLTTDTLNLVLGYLGKRPYEEVTRIIQAIYSETNPQIEELKAAQPLEIVEGGNNGTEKA